MMTPKGLVFDCDGTLADTMPLHWRAWSLITQRHNLHFPEDRFYSLGGVPSRDILKMLAEEQGRSLDHIAVAHEKEEAYMPLMAQVEPIHVVVEIARANHGKIPMAVASGGTQKIICQVLEHLKIRHLFAAVVTSDGKGLVSRLSNSQLQLLAIVRIFFTVAWKTILPSRRSFSRSRFPSLPWANFLKG